MLHRRPITFSSDPIILVLLWYVFWTTCQEETNDGWLQTTKCNGTPALRRVKRKTLESQDIILHVSDAGLQQQGEILYVAGLHAWQLYNSQSTLTVMSACSHRRQEADRQLQLSFDNTETERTHLTQTPNQHRYCISCFPPMHTHTFNLHAFLSSQLCPKWNNSLLRGTQSWQRARRLYPWAAAFCSHWFSFMHRKSQEGNLPCLRLPLVSRQALYLPIYRHSRLNTLPNRGCFLSEASLSGGGTAWIYCLNNILHLYTLSVMTKRNNRT